jgi:hypothetical protein
MGKNRHLILSIIAGSALLGCSVAMAADAVDTAEGKPAENLSAPVDEKPGPLGLIVNGASSGINTDYLEQIALEAIEASGIFSAIDNSKAAEVILPMIRAKGVFPGAALSGDAPYVLKIRVIKVEAPSFAIRMTVDMRVVWTLYRTIDKASLLHEVITSTYKGAAFEGGFIGANRARVGTEGAARENVRLGMEFLEVLDFDMEPLGFEQGVSEFEQDVAESE